MRRGRVALLTILVVALIAVSAAPANAGKAKRVHLDRSFGTGGWATLPLPRKITVNSHVVDVDCSTSGRGKSLILISISKSSGRTVAARLVLLDARGRRVRSFGRNGLRSFRPTNLPTAVDRHLDGWIVKYAVSRSAGTVWKLVRYDKRGEPDRRFGSRGVLRFDAEPFAQLLGDGDFVAERVVYRANGRPDARMNGTGELTDPFTSVTQARDGRLLAIGRPVDGVFSIAKLERDGRLAPDWANGVAIEIPMPPESIWRRGLSSYEPTGIANPSLELVRETTRFAEARYSTELLTNGESERYLHWIMRFSRLGVLDTRRNTSGLSNRTVETVQDSLEAGDDEFYYDSYYLPDGRLVDTEFVIGSEQDPFRLVVFRISDRSGRLNSRGARIFSDRSVWVENHDFDATGRTMVMCGERRGRIVAARVPLTSSHD